MAGEACLFPYPGCERGAAAEAGSQPEGRQELEEPSRESSCTLNLASTPTQSLDEDLAF